MDTEKIIQGFSILDAKYNALMHELINTYHFDGLRDVRVNLIKHPRIVIDSTLIFFLIRQDNLFRDSWWDRMKDLKLINKDFTENDQKTFSGAFDSYTDSAYITMLLFGMESGFRSLYLSVFGEDPPFNFSKVYPKLLNRFGLEEYNKLLRLSSNIRNSLHNNGILTHPDESITWRKKKYEFKKDQSLMFDPWETFIIITDDISVCLRNSLRKRK